MFKKKPLLNTIKYCLNYLSDEDKEKIKEVIIELLAATAKAKIEEKINK